MKLTQSEIVTAKSNRKLKRGELALLARKHNIKPDTVRRRLKSDWTLEEALTVPVMSREETGHYGRQRQIEKESLTKH